MNLISIRCYSEKLATFIDSLLHKKMQTRPLIDEMMRYFESEVARVPIEKIDSDQFQAIKGRLLIYNLRDRNLTYTNKEFSNMKMRILNKSMYERKKLHFIKAKIVDAIKKDRLICNDIIINELKSQNIAKKYSKFRLYSAMTNERPSRSSTTTSRKLSNKFQTRLSNEDKSRAIIEKCNFHMPPSVQYSPHVPCTTVAIENARKTVMSKEKLSSSNTQLQTEMGTLKSSINCRCITAAELGKSFDMTKSIEPSNDTHKVKKVFKKFTIHDLQ